MYHVFSILWLIYLSLLKLFCLVIGVKVRYNFRLKLFPTIADHRNIKTCHKSSSFWFLNFSSVTLIMRVAFPYQAGNYPTYCYKTETAVGNFTLLQTDGLPTPIRGRGGEGQDCWCNTIELEMREKLSLMKGFTLSLVKYYNCNTFAFSSALALW